MRKTLTTVALMLALCCTAFAGEMGTPPVAPTQPQANTAQEPTMTNEDTTGAADTLTQTILTLLVSLLP